MQQRSITNRIVWLGCVVTCLLVVCLGQPRAALADDGLRTDDSRLSVDLTAAMFADYPNSMTDPGGAAVGRYSFWAARNSWFGADASVAGVLGVGKSPAVHTGASIAMGGTVFIFDWLAIEIDMGPYLGAQIDGDALVPVVGMLGAGAYRFQFGAHTVRFAMALAGAGVLADDPGNDCAMCSGFLAGGLGYDFRF